MPIMDRQQREKPTDKKQMETDPGPPEITEADRQAIIIEGDAVKLNDKARELGAYLCEDHYSPEQKKPIKKLSSSQIRNILYEIQRMQGQQFNPKRLQLLRPKMAYAAGRHKGKVMVLQQVTDQAIQMVTNKEQFENFRHFFEAIVAYHRYHGGE
jgi:CRISPR type III-A-associated protein Csm2